MHASASPYSPYVAILAHVCKLAQQNFTHQCKNKKVLFLFIQPFLSQKVMDLAQGHHDLYTNLWNLPSLKIFKGSTVAYIQSESKSNKVPPNVWFFSGESGKVIPKYISYSKLWFIGLQRSFEFFNSIQAINIYVNFTKVSQVSLCTYKVLLIW